MSMSASVPDLKFVLKNERKHVEAMAREVAKAVKRSTSLGKDAHGRPMAKPKDAGTPENPKGKTLDRSGTLLGSIAAVEKKSRRKAKPGKRAPVRFVVRATGKRPAEENAKQKKKRARERTKQMRAAAVIGEAFGGLATGRLGPRKKKGKGIRLSRIKVRAADTNAALAGILSVPPKDKRGKSGNRKTYRVFEASDRYIDLAAHRANRSIKKSDYDVKQVGTKKIRVM